MNRKVVTAILVVGICVMNAALGPSPASAAHTEKCTEASPGVGTTTFYETFECDMENQVSGKWHRLTTGGTWFTRIFRRSFQVVQTKALGSSLKFQCTGLTNSSGSAENVEEGSVRTVKGNSMVLEYSGCTVSEPSGCKIAGGAIKTNSLKTLATTNEGQSRVAFDAETEGGNIASVKIEGCAIAGTYPLKGSLVGVVPKSNESLIEFTSTSGSSLSFGKEAAAYTGNTTAEVEGTSEIIFIGQ